MEFVTTALPEVIKIVPRVFSDERGFFMETWQAKLFRENVADVEFVQDNFSQSSKGTLRGLHSIKTGRPRYPDAPAVLEIARGRVQRDELPHPDEVRPHYLREPDVTINWTDFRSEGPWR